MNRGTDLMLWGEGEQRKQKNRSHARRLRVDRFHVRRHAQWPPSLPCACPSVLDSMTITDGAAERAVQSNRTKRGYRCIDIVVTHTSLRLQSWSRTATVFAEDSSWKAKYCNTARNCIYCYRKFLSLRQLHVRPFLDQNVKKEVKKRRKCFTNLHSVWINSAATKKKRVTLILALVLKRDSLNRIEKNSWGRCVFN